MFLGRRSGESVERGWWAGVLGEIFREVKRKRGGILGRRSGGKCGEWRVLGLWGRFLGK